MIFTAFSLKSGGGLLPPILPPMSSCCRWKAQTSLYSSLSFVPTTKSEQVSTLLVGQLTFYEGLVISECNVLDSSIFSIFL